MPRALFFMACVIICAALGGVIAVMVQRSGTYAHRPIGGPFAMVDTDGKPVTQADLLGKPTVLFFGYTACPDICPTTLSLLTNVMHRMGRDADRLNVVFATVDPSRDTPSALNDYLSSFDPRIRGLTGTEAQVAAMTAAFHIHRERIAGGDGSYTVAHTANALLLDASEHFVGEIYYGEDEASLFAKLTTLAPAPVCRPGAPGPADLWSPAATFGPGQTCGST